MEGLSYYTEIRIFLLILVSIFISALSREVFSAKNKKIKPFKILSSAFVLGLITYGFSERLLSNFDFRGLVAICGAIGFVAVEILGKFIEYAQKASMNDFIVDILEYMLSKLKKK